MKIAVAGLGIIGGSVCMALKRAGYFVAGWNRSAEPLEYALKNKIIDEVVNAFEEYDVVFVVLPPEATVGFLTATPFKRGAVVCDMCGVKGAIEKAVLSAPRGYRYVGCHPMAGNEVSGIKNACAELFDGANMVITRNSQTDAAAAAIIEKLTADMGFGYIAICSADVHDRKIGYTSQLAHIVSNAYVRDAEMRDCLNFTGGSFQDMTRIAGVDEKVWSSLYLFNSENVVTNIDNLIASLQKIKNAVQSGDKSLLEGELAAGRELFERDKNNCKNTEIIIKKLM